MEDFWIVVFEQLEAPIDFRELGLTCRGALCKLKRHKDKLLNCRHLERLLKLFPDKPWNWYLLSQNQTIRLKFIQQNLDLKWKFDELSTNPNISWEFVEKNLDRGWNFEGLSLNPNITWNIVQ